MNVTGEEGEVGNIVPRQAEVAQHCPQIFYFFPNYFPV